MRTIPSWVITDSVDDVDLGVIKTGKEAQVNLIERHGHTGRSCVFARKRYLPREVTSKGELQALGVQRSSAFVNDVQYREGRQFRKSRDRRAVERMSTYGKRLLQDRWMGHEYEVMSRLWQAGMAARLDADALHRAFEQLLSGLEILVGEGYAHGDLSAYNLLWWEDTLWFIDFPQAVDIAENPQGLEFLHRDVLNVCGWFAHQGYDVDGEEVFAHLLTP
ncbi:MAG: RIO1 family regulatory kinase/ATPase [Ilumatobacter sp.]